MPLVDPPEPPEARERLNARNLKGQYLILRPTKHDVVPGTKPNDRGEIKPWEFVEADVWVFDRSGVTAHETGVRFSWWRAVAQLKDAIGTFVACRPMEQEDNSVVLVALSGDARVAAETALKEIQAAPSVGESPIDNYDEAGEEPF